MSQYKEAGVDIDAADQSVDRFKQAVRETHGPDVLTDIGSFGGLFALRNLPDQPILVASTDSVGTKVELAASLGRFRGLGHDIVNHCVNDILVQNARPLFFLDYVATAKLHPDVVAEIVIGVAEACQQAGCALLGGELAEMPGTYVDGAYDLVGSVVGLVNQSDLLPDCESMQAGDILMGLPSSGPHTNGYSLIRKVMVGRDLNEKLDRNLTLADALLASHRCYLSEIDQLQHSGVQLKGLTHITGGGFLDNIPRVLPEHLAAQLTYADRQIPVIFQRLVEWSGMERDEAFRVFNMGIGMVLIIQESDVGFVNQVLPESVKLGQLVERDRGQPGVAIDDQ
ncbi:phosphoribosylformylglycinamidine cyclo-ligase [Chloroflexi bacterium TSY]|nr:phosphoribosylformylglycinamidine cyclo-ligase [Chloroflexi bacterium TSY]